jgi:hypothetical protein
MPSTANDTALRYVDSRYRHQPKEVTPRPQLDVRGARLKWYDIAPKAEPVPEAIEQLARSYLLAQAEAGALGFDGELGFVILHRCGASFYFLLVQTWRGSNELWETILHKENEAMKDFAPFTFQTPHRGTFCVWELGAVFHEKDAWVRFLESERNAEAQQQYLSATFQGTV